MNQQIILESLVRALESWVRNASAAELWRVHREGGLGAPTHTEGETAVHVASALRGPPDARSSTGKTDGRLPMTEAFRGANGEAGWGTPPPQGSAEREQWFLSSDVAQEQARQYLLAEVVARRDALVRRVEAWAAGAG